MRASDDDDAIDENGNDENDDDDDDDNDELDRWAGRVWSRHKSVGLGVRLLIL